MKKRRLIAFLSAAALALSMAGCAQSTESGTTDTTSASADSENTDSTLSEESDDTSAEETSSSDNFGTDDDMFTDRDLAAAYDEDECVSIVLEGDSAAASSNSVLISGSTITITEEAVYIISGTLDDGMIVVDASDSAKIQLVLDGVDINSETSAAVYILEADKVFITLAEGSENTLSNGGSFVAIDDNNIDAVIFSKQDLTLNGSGTLTIESPAGHGIVGKDDLVITGGTYEITSASHGLDANDSIRITGDTTITANTGKDGLHAENSDDETLGFVYISGGSFYIEAQGDGISAGSSMQITGGTFEILAGGGYENGESESSDNWGNFGGGGFGRQQSMGQRQSASAASAVSENETDDSSTSMKGIKAGDAMLITGGTFVIDSADDSVHSNSAITIEDGTFEIATGDDGFHADEYLTVNGGSITISASYEGLEALYLEINGGDISIVSTDDGLNAAGGTDSSGTTGGRDGMFGGGWASAGSSNGTLVITGGTIYINASGDGIDSNGTLEISGGSITVSAPTQGDTSVLDFDVSGTISGGTFIGTGASSMAQTFDSSSQAVISVSVGTQEAGSSIIISDSEGNVIFEYTPELSYQVVIYSSEELVAGETYTIVAGTASGEYTTQTVDSE